MSKLLVNPANLCTISRIIIAPWIAFLIIQGGSFRLVLFLTLVAGLTDWIDGYLARAYNFSSKFGQILDPIADKILFFFLYLSLGYVKLLPYWMVGLVFLRDILILLLGTEAVFRKKKIDLSPIMLSKINTGLQILLVLNVLLGFSGNYLIYLTACTTIISGLIYLKRWYKGL